MLHLYRLLLRLYPRDYFAEFAEEMTSVFRQAQQDYQRRSRKDWSVFCVREMSGLLCGALREHIRYRDQSVSLGRFDMRSFRFPRWTIVLMLMILLGMVVAIEKGRSLSIELASGSSVHSVWWPGFFLMALTLMAGAGGIGYGLLVVLGKAGIQRFTSIQTWPSTKDDRRPL